MLFSTLLLGHEEGPTGAFAPKNPSKICPVATIKKLKQRIMVSYDYVFDLIDFLFI